MQSKYSKIKQIIKNILMFLPKDTFSDNIYYDCSWELINSRKYEIDDTEFNDCKIGSENLITATIYLRDSCLAVDKQAESKSIVAIFENIMEELAKEKFIRIKPNILRNKLKIITTI